MSKFKYLGVNIHVLETSYGSLKEEVLVQTSISNRLAGWLRWTIWKNKQLRKDAEECDSTKLLI